MTLVGYARVSRVEQNLDLQLAALRQAGCDPIFEEKVSGGRETRPQLDECLRYLRAGDTLVVWKLDRLGRVLSHLVRLMHDLEQRGVGFRSLTQPELDTTTPTGRLMFGLFAVLAEYERAVTRERTNAGLERARARGRRGGRKPALAPPDARRALAEYEAGEISMERLARRFRVGTTTLYRAFRQLRTA